VGLVLEVDEMVVNIYYYYIVLADHNEWQCKITHRSVGCVGVGGGGGGGGGGSHRRVFQCLVWLTTYPHPPL